MVDQRPGVAPDVRHHGVHVAPLALGAPGGVPLGVLEPGADVDRGAQLVPEQRQRRVPEGERRVVGDGLGHGLHSAGPETQQVAHAPRVGVGRLDAGGEGEAVGVATMHVSRVRHQTMNCWIPG